MDYTYNLNGKLEKIPRKGILFNTWSVSFLMAKSSFRTCVFIGLPQAQLWNYHSQCRFDVLFVKKRLIVPSLCDLPQLVSRPSISHSYYIFLGIEVEDE